MTTLQEDSLFSLELVVDKLTLPNIPCRFPAVAFRILDFPTLIIYHIEPEVGGKIKVKIKSDPYYKLGNQIEELLDKDGNFSIQKGKSCLLKISPDLMLSHLSNTPLYVMVIDTFPDVPKLIGNCTVPLDSVMENLYGDICQNGLAIPSVRGEKGFYKVYNLMGVQIGGLALGFRLLSLGIGLIPHLPATSISKTKLTREPDVTELPSKLEKDIIQEKVAKIVLDDACQTENIPCKHVQNFFPAETQTMQNVQNVSIQTIKRKQHSQKCKKKTALITSLQDELDDIVITNTVCPPPLYFNSENEKFSLNMDNLASYSEKCVSDDSFSDNDTIRLEDWNSDNEEYVKNKPKDHTKKGMKQTKSKQQPNVLPSKSQNIPKSFPLLNALMKEITALQGEGNPQKRPARSEIYIARPNSSNQSVSRARSPSPSHHGPSYSRSPSPGRERQSVEKFVQRMSTPRHIEVPIQSPKTPRKVLPEPKKPLKLHKCQEAPKPVPKSKSWVRYTPHHKCIKKTEYSPASTKSQRLRLEKYNPQLLKKIEDEEKERKEKLREKRIMDQQKIAESNTALYGMDGHRLSEKSKTMIIHNRPKPAPRIYYQDNNNYREFEEHQVPLSNRNTTHGQEMYDNIPTRDNELLVETEKIMSDPNGTGDKIIVQETNDTSLEISVKKLSDPGFPTTDSILNYSNDYEADYKQTQYDDERNKNSGNLEKTDVEPAFETVDAGAELGLRKIVDQFSDDSEESFQSANSKFSEPFPVKNGYVPLGPKVSVATPAIRNGHKMADNQIEVSVDSTAYISKSQVLSQQSYESNICEEPESSKDFRPRPTPRKRRNTESVSSYNGDENYSPRSPTPGNLDYEYESFEDESDSYINKPLTVDQARVSADAKLSYTYKY